MTYLDLRRHIAERFDEATLEAFPYPHIIIADFFQPDVYEKILAFNPFKQNLGKHWIAPEHIGNTGNETPYDRRRQINFHHGDAYEALPEARVFWTALKETFLGGAWFPKLVYRKYPEYFGIRYGDIVTSDEFWKQFRPQLFVQRHEPGYYIGPHTDIALRVFTCIFAFASQNGYEKHGTLLLRHRDPYVRSSGSKHHSFDGFDIVKTAEYRPNSFFLFFRTDHSFHAVAPVGGDVPNERYGMQYQFHEPGNGLLRDIG